MTAAPSSPLASRTTEAASLLSLSLGDWSRLHGLLGMTNSAIRADQVTALRALGVHRLSVSDSRALLALRHDNLAATTPHASL